MIALADALVHDDEATIRRVSALALEKLIDAHIADDARELGLDALDRAAANDGDQKVRDTAARIAKELSGLHRRKETAPPPSDKPPVFINIGTTLDQSKKLPNDGADRLTKVVKKNVERTGYATTWPGRIADVGRARKVAGVHRRVDRQDGRDHEGGAQDRDRLHRRDPRRDVERQGWRRALGSEQGRVGERLGESDDW